MRSKWFDLKPKAIELRQQGISLREIEKILNIPRSTLSGWFKNVQLTLKQKRRLLENRLKHLHQARIQAVKWHHKQKALRLKEAEKQAIDILSKLDNKNQSVEELALAMLYLGEGSKTKSGTVLGSSDSLILKFFISSLLKNHNIDINQIKCSLHLRADQNPELLSKHWSRALNIPLSNFTSPSIDLRTKGTPTYPGYNGVCVVNCGNIALQRKLIYLSRKFCERVMSKI